MIQEIRERLKGLSDDEVLELLDTVSDEVKRRNRLMGAADPSLDKDAIRSGMQTVLDALVKVQGPPGR